MIWEVKFLEFLSKNNVVYCVKGFRKICRQASDVGVSFQKFGHVMVENDLSRGCAACWSVCKLVVE